MLRAAVLRVPFLAANSKCNKNTWLLRIAQFSKNWLLRRQQIEKYADFGSSAFALFRSAMNLTRKITWKKEYILGFAAQMAARSADYDRRSEAGSPILENYRGSFDSVVDMTEFNSRVFVVHNSCWPEEINIKNLGSAKYLNIKIVIKFWV